MESAAAEKTTFFNGEGYQNPSAMSEHTFTLIKFLDYETERPERVPLLQGDVHALQ